MEGKKSGYDVGIFVNKPSYLCECSLCSNILKDPRQCSKGHLFCNDCIMEALVQNKECPTCNDPLNEKTLSMNLFVSLTIDDMPVYCISCESKDINDQSRCIWSGPLKDRRVHYEYQCDYFESKCTNFGCAAVVLRKDLAKHTQECPERLTKCSFCNTMVQFKNYDSHQLTCVARHVPCVNGCGCSVPLDQMNRHCSRECSLETADCPLFKDGKCSAQNCRGTMTRGDAAAHFINADASDVIFSLAAEIKQTEMKCTGLAAANSDLLMLNKDYVDQIDALAKQVKLLRNSGSVSGGALSRSSSFSATNRSGSFSLGPGSPPPQSPSNRSPSKSIGPLSALSTPGQALTRTSSMRSPSKQQFVLNRANANQAALDKTLKELSPEVALYDLSSSETGAGPITSTDCHLIREWVSKESDPQTSDPCVLLLTQQLNAERGQQVLVRHVAFEFNWADLQAKGVKSIKSSDVVMGDDLIARVSLGKVIKTNDIKLCSYLFGYNEEYSVITTICVFNKRETGGSGTAGTRHTPFTCETVYNKRGKPGEHPVIELASFLGSNYISLRDNMVRVLTTFVVPTSSK